jgi:type I restriction enzyme S subunit
VSEWKEYKLGELIAINEKSVGRNFIADIIEYIDTSCVTENKFESPLITTRADAPSRAKRLISNGDTIISTVRPIQKHYGFIKKAKSNHVVSTGFAVVTPKGIEPRFLYYFLTQQEITDYLNTIAEGGTTTFPAFKAEELREIPIYLPDLPIQTAIAEILSSLDDKIELNNKINQELENLAQTLFKQWFIDFEFPDENGEPYKSSGGEMVESELGEIPKGWGVGTTYDISDVIYGAPFKSALFNQENKGFPLIRIRDLKTFKPQYWTEESHPKGTKIYAGDLIVGMDAEFRPQIWLGQESWLNQRLCHFRPKTRFSKLFVREIIRPQLAFFENSSVGTTVIHLGKADIDTFKSIIPTVQTLSTFEELSNSIFNEIVSNSMENQHLIQLRDTLLPKLISGELEVSQTQTTA